MGIHDRDWYRDHHKARSQPSSQEVPDSPDSASSEPDHPRDPNRIDRVAPRPGRPVLVRARPPGLLSRIAQASAWKIALFWVAVAAGLTFFFQPVVAERAAKRLIEPAAQIFCSATSKCT